MSIPKALTIIIDYKFSLDKSISLRQTKASKVDVDPRGFVSYQAKIR